MTGTNPTALVVWGGLAYLAWLRFGSRPNPPIDYEDFKTGLTFESVRELLGLEADAAYEAGQYMFVSRGTVLGRWHEMKQQQYDRYLEGYAEQQAALDEGLPF